MSENPLAFSILKLFDRQYDGLPAAWFTSSSEAHNAEAALRQAGQSYRTKILKSKKAGRQFVVMLVSPP